MSFVDYRKNPRITQFDYLTLKKLSELLRINIERALKNKTDLRVLDLGCGNKPYRAYFDGKYSLYIGIDPSPRDSVEIIAVGEWLPLRDETFDVCIMTQVLEHVESPYLVIKEVHRTLRRNGILILSIPGIWPVNKENGDYWRWTDQGLKRLLGNFSRVKISECGGPALTMIQLLLTYVPKTRASLIITVILNFVGYVIDKARTVNARLPRLILNYIGVATK